ncbi:hypothetical protein [Corynebacterium ulceribovis]|uniref:hypothetical protein n=1 Tax=Corynebacterium ulceribovis TaxID=487732 RepID=UPI00035FBF09|nr:hypothetical protein [Corynebacterium ulceribovis]
MSTPHDHNDDAPKPKRRLGGQDRPGKISEADLDFDPLLRLELEQKSRRQAIFWAIGTMVAILVSAMIIAFIGRAVGGPNCDAGYSSFMCSRTFELAFPLIPAAIALGGTFGAMWICYVKWSRYQKWTPWLAITWLLIPVSLLWITSTAQFAILGLPLR